MLLNTGRSFDLEVITPLYYSLRVWGGVYITIFCLRQIYSRINIAAAVKRMGI